MPLPNILSSDDALFTSSLGHWALIGSDSDSYLYRNPPDTDWWGWPAPAAHAGSHVLERMGGYSSVGLVGSSYSIPDRHLVRFTCWIYAGSLYLWGSAQWINVGVQPYPTGVPTDGIATPVQGGNSSLFSILAVDPSDSATIAYWSGFPYLIINDNEWHQFVGFCAVDPYLTALNGTNNITFAVSGLGGGTFISRAWMSDVSVVHQAIPPITGFTATAFHPRRVDLAWDAWDDLDLEINQDINAAPYFPFYPGRVLPAATTIVVERSSDGGATWESINPYFRWTHTESRATDDGWIYSPTDFSGPQPGGTYKYRAYRGWGSTTYHGSWGSDFVARSGYTPVVTVTMPPLMADPVDEPGWQLTTRHVFADNELRTYSADSLTTSLDEKTIYMPEPSRDITVGKVDTADWTWSPWPGVSLSSDTMPVGIMGISSAPNGTVYGIKTFWHNSEIFKVHPDGTVDSVWVDIPGTQMSRIVAARDGRVYALSRTNTIDVEWRYQVFCIQPSGSYAEIPELRIPASEVYQHGYGGMAAASDGTVWLVCDGPGMDSANFDINNTLRRYRPGIGADEVPIQRLISPGNDGHTEMYGGIYCDWQDHVLVPLVTYPASGDDPLHSSELSWFLRVAPDGTVRRVAGTWVYPQTITNIADGPLGTGLACQADSWDGISPNKKTLYFVDDGDQVNRGYSNLLRVLELIPPPPPPPPPPPILVPTSGRLDLHSRPIG